LILSSSFKPERDIFAFPPRLLFTPTTAHYAALWARWPDFFAALGNSLLITAMATLLAVTASLTAGYAYSRFRGRWLAASAFGLIVVRLIPPIVCTLPLFPAANALGLQDTHVWLAVLYATFFVSLGTFVMRAFIDQIPRELDEAAAVDGAGRFRTLFRVIAPLAAQGMLAVAVFVIVYAWNEFLFAFIFTSTRARTAPLVLAEIIGNFDGVEWGVLFAAASVQLAPVLAFVWITQKYLVAGLTAGATKG
jgi:multiple sugar transport system permease protein